MPGRSRPGSTSWSQSQPMVYSSSFVDSLASRQNDLDAVARGVARGDLVIYANFTDDEDENNPPNYFSGLSNLEPLSPVLDEEVITRTGEASRLRRRGALHGRRHQYTYTTLSCGVELPWRFRIEPDDVFGKWNSKSLLSSTSEFQKNDSVRTGKIPLEFPSTGCRSVLTTCAFVPSHQNVYTASESMDIVTPVELSYLDEEQEEVANQFLGSISSFCEWKPVACRQCGNVVGLQYWQIFHDENGNPLEDAYGRVTISRFAFFPSAVTSSKPYNFAEGKFYPETSIGRRSSVRPVSSGPALRSRRSVELRRPDVLYQEPPTINPPERLDQIQVRLPLASQSESNSRPQRLSSETILPSIPENSLDTSGPTQEEEQDNVSWATWMPNPYVYSSESENEDGETIERQLEQRRLRLSEAISILQTTHEEFMSNEYPDEVLDEMELPPLEPVTALAAEDTQQSMVSNNAHPPEVSTQISNPYPYTHLSSSAPVPPSISARTREVNRQDQQGSNDASQPGGDPSLPLASSSTLSFDAHVGDQSHLMPAHLPISYDSPASISDIEASNHDTGEVESIGILVEVEPPPQNITSSFGSAVVVPSLVDHDEHVQRHTLDYIHVTPPTDCLSSPSSGREENSEDNNGSSMSGFEHSMTEESEERYADFDSKTDNLFNINAPTGVSPIAMDEVYNLDLQSTNLSPYREYTPSLPPLSPGALATPSLPYSPTTSVPLPPTLLPLMEILDSIDIEVLPLARYSDLDDSESESETSDTDSRSEDQNPRDESVYTTELPWDRSDSDSQWPDYDGSPMDFQLPWSTESIEPVFPFPPPTSEEGR